MESQIIVTGFKPFSVYSINSSWEAAKVLHLYKETILIKELHVDHLIAHQQICNLLENAKCDILLLSGLTYRNHISLETIARKPFELKFIEGPSILKAISPWKTIVEQLQSFNIPIDISEDAGQYVCESVFWSALNFKRNNGYPSLVGFMHVPPISPVWSANRIAEIMRLTLESALNVEDYS